MATPSDTVPAEGLTFKRVDIWYCLKGEDAYVRLDNTVHGKSMYNGGRVLLQYGLQFEQASPGRKAFVTAKWALADLQGDPAINNVENDCLEVIIKVASPPKIIVNGDQLLLPGEFPLAKTAPSFSKVKMILPLEDMKPRQDPSTTRRFIGHFLTMRQSTIAATPVGLFIKNTMEASLKESEAQAALLLAQEECRIKTSIFGGNRIALEVWPKFSKDMSEEDRNRVKEQNFGLRYSILDCTTFPARTAPKIPNEEVAGWQMHVVDTLPGLDAPIIGLVANPITPNNDLATYDKKVEPGVSLVPIVDDVVGAQGRKALRGFGEDRDEFARRMTISFPKEDFKLPLAAMFIPGETCEHGKNLTGITRTAPVARVGQTIYNPSQQEAIRKAIEHVVSLIWGPAATGKSKTLAGLLLELLGDRKEKVLHLTSRHVAVDALIQRAEKSWQEAYGDTPAPFVRLYSEAAILSQHVNRSPLLAGRYHIDNLRVAHANAAGNTTFLSGRSELIRQGFIEGKEQLSKYLNARSAVTRAVMSSCRAVFGTVASCMNTALVWKLPGQGRGEKEPEVMTWGPTTLIFDEYACSTEIELLIPLMSFKTLGRTVLAGDENQLGPFILDEWVKKLWAVTHFERIKQKDFPVTMLNVAYRQHNNLADPVYNVIYGSGVVSQFHRTSQPRPFLHRIKSSLPVTFIAGGLQYRISSFGHFFDIHNGQEEGHPSGSKKNLAELHACLALAETLLNTGIDAGKNREDKILAICTGYKSQLTEIKERIKTLGASSGKWNLVHTLSADEVQGDEFEIVIQSLVRTDNGVRGFVGQKRRANVMCTRARECNLFVGSYSHWVSANTNRSTSYLDRILFAYRKAIPAFVVRGVQLATSPAPRPLLPGPVFPSVPLPSRSAPHLRARSQQSTTATPSSHSQTSITRAVVQEEEKREASLRKHDAEAKRRQQQIAEEGAKEMAVVDKEIAELEERMAVLVERKIKLAAETERKQEEDKEEMTRRRTRLEEE